MLCFSCMQYNHISVGTDASKEIQNEKQVKQPKMVIHTAPEENLQRKNKARLHKPKSNRDRSSIQNNIGLCVAFFLDVFNYIYPSLLFYIQSIIFTANLLR